MVKVAAIIILSIFVYLLAELFYLIFCIDHKFNVEPEDKPTTYLVRADDGEDYEFLDKQLAINCAKKYGGVVFDYNNEKVIGTYEKEN